MLLHQRGNLMNHLHCIPVYDVAVFLLLFLRYFYIHGIVCCIIQSLRQDSTFRYNFRKVRQKHIVLMSTSSSINSCWFNYMQTCVLQKMTLITCMQNVEIYHYISLESTFEIVSAILGTHIFLSFFFFQV